MPRVLVVDDNGPIVRALAMLIEQAGASRVDIAHNGIEGYALLQANKFDLVVLDNHMPGMSGMQLLQEIQRPGSELNSSPVVMFSAFDEGRDEALELGAIAFINKSRIVEDLLPLIKERMETAAA